MKTVTSLDIQKVAIFMKIKLALGLPHANMLSSTPLTQFKLTCYFTIKLVRTVFLV